MGGTYTGLAPMLMVDEKSAHMNWSNDKLKRGQIINIEMAGSYLHYHCPIARTIFIGNEEDLKNSIYKNIYQIEDCLHKAMAAILDLIKPGINVKVISSYFNKILEEGNIKKKSRIAYSFGIGFPPDWGENTISIRQESNEILQEGMTLHLIFGAGDAWGLSI